MIRQKRKAPSYAAFGSSRGWKRPKPPRPPRCAAAVAASDSAMTVATARFMRRCPRSCMVLPDFLAEIALGDRLAVLEANEMLDVEFRVDEDARRLRLHRRVELRRRRLFRHRHIIGPD